MLLDYDPDPKSFSRRAWMRSAAAASSGLLLPSWLMDFPSASSAWGAAQPLKQRRILLDTDAKNEIDDQYAILRALIAPELKVEGLTAAGFAGQKDSAQRSYDEILKLLKLMKLDGKVSAALGSSLALKDKRTPDESDAAKLIIEKAMAVSDEPLYVIAIGQATNLAAALLMEPRIKDRVVFVILGGSYDTNITPSWGVADFNWHNKWTDVQAILESDVPVLHVPAVGVTQRMVMTRDEMAKHLPGHGPACDYLASLWEIPMVKGKPQWVMWDIAAIHQMIEPTHGKSIKIPAPVVHKDGTVTEADSNSRQIEVLVDLDPRVIFDRFWNDLEAAEWLWQ